ncbi:MAG: type III-B CRISPR module-associated Cmr3 family protein [Myxococcota bacterium]
MSKAVGQATEKTAEQTIRPGTESAAGTSVTIGAQLWLLDPRDPVVLGDGRTNLSLGGQNAWPFPLPGTVAGMVRTTLLRGQTEVTPELARALLRVRVRGPWLLPPASTPDDLRFFAPADVRLEQKGVSNAASSALPAPEKPPAPEEHLYERLVGGQLLKLSSDEGVLWPAPSREDDNPLQAPIPRCLVELQERTKNGAKCKPMSLALWPLKLLVLWNLGIRPNGGGETERVSASRKERLHPQSRDLEKWCQALADEVVAEADKGTEYLLRESRIHVALDDQRLTAEPGMLFSSSGLRLKDGWKLGMEVCLPEPLPAILAELPALSQGEQLAYLGGEARPAFLDVASLQARPAGAFPPFEHFAELYWKARVRADGLRLQLLTPAFLPYRESGGGRYHQHGDPGWCPSWLLEGHATPAAHPAVSALLKEHRQVLRLEALCLPDHHVVSGWNLQARSQRDKPRADARMLERTGAPREVRRLVPAGSVYYLRLDPLIEGAALDEADHQRLLLELCRALWGQSFDPVGPGECDDAMMYTEFRAPASADGYGLLLPGFWRYPDPSEKTEEDAKAHRR